MKYLKIFSVFILITLLGIKGCNTFDRYWAISAIDDHQSSLIKVEGNKLYLGGVLPKGSNYPGYGYLKSGRELTEKEYNCMNEQGIFNAAYDNNYLYIICYSNNDELLYIGYD